MQDENNNVSEGARFFVENGVPHDYRTFQDCINAGGRLRMDQWDYLTVIAWVGSRNEAFTAGVQRFCRQECISPYRGGPFYGPARIVVSLAMRDTTWTASFNEAAEELREALEGGRLEGTALALAEGARVTIKCDEWHAFEETSRLDGFSLVEGYRDHQWLSSDVLAAFPPPAHQPIAREPVPPRPAERWQSQRVKDEVAELMRFFSVAERAPDDLDPQTLKALHAQYQDWHRRNHLRCPLLKRTAFEKWHGRYLGGYRVKGHRLELPQ